MVTFDWRYLMLLPKGATQRSGNVIVSKIKVICSPLPTHPSTNSSVNLSFSLTYWLSPHPYLCVCVCVCVCKWKLKTLKSHFVIIVFETSHWVIYFLWYVHRWKALQSIWVHIGDGEALHLCTCHKKWITWFLNVEATKSKWLFSIFNSLSLEGIDFAKQILNLFNETNVFGPLLQ